jgi:hypothetical protein
MRSKRPALQPSEARRRRHHRDQAQPRAPATLHTQRRHRRGRAHHVPQGHLGTLHFAVCGRAGAWEACLAVSHSALPCITLDACQPRGQLERPHAKGRRSECRHPARVVTHPNERHATQITQDGPLTACCQPDAMITPTGGAVRAFKGLKTAARRYSVKVQATDAKGRSCTVTRAITVTTKKVCASCGVLAGLAGHAGLSASSKREQMGRGAAPDGAIPIRSLAHCHRGGCLQKLVGGSAPHAPPLALSHATATAGPPLPRLPQTSRRPRLRRPHTTRCDWAPAH